MASSGAKPATRPRSTAFATYLPYLLAGTYFGFVLIKSEVVSWYRIQEMFRFQSFHMYGVLASAWLVAAVSIWLIKRYNVRTVGGDAITFAAKDPTYPRYIFGGIIFGLGWGLTGACPGPIFALIGSGLSVFMVILTSALLGTWTYARLRPRLPH